MSLKGGLDAFRLSLESPRSVFAPAPVISFVRTSYARRPRSGAARSIVIGAGVLAVALSAMAPMARGDGFVRISHRAVEAIEAPRVSFDLRGSHGYKISVRGSANGVVLIASRRHSAAVYFDDEGWADESGIYADFGGLGEISVSFEEAGGSTRRLPYGSLRHCQARNGALDRFGTFGGWIEFHGEHGFTEVVRRRARGRVSPERMLRCRVREEAGVGQSESGLGALTVSAFTPARWAVSTAGPEALSKLRWRAGIGPFLHLLSLPKRGAAFVVEQVDERDGTLIGRVAAARGGTKTFEVDRSYGVVRIRPPRPFSGEATYSACEKRHSNLAGWRGSLVVDLPGARHFNLMDRRLLTLVRLSPGIPCPRWPSGRGRTGARR